MGAHLTKRLEAPTGVSKSMAKSMGCLHFFVHQYLRARHLQTVGASSALAVAGSQFHKYRASYIEHLVKQSMTHDHGWIYWYVSSNNVSEEAERLILSDIQSGFRVNPDCVYGAEVFLSCDSNLQPLDHEIGNAAPGKLSAHPDAFASATLDLLCIDGAHATVIDPKSGFSTVGVTDDEPPINALVVFAHFPMVQTVEFRWDFVRSRTNRRATYSRASDLEWMVKRVHELNAIKQRAVDAFNRGEPLELNPFAGLCGYCVLQCPLRAQADVRALGPIQTDKDARRVAGMIHVCEQYLEQARALIKPFLNERGPLQLTPELCYTPEVIESSSYPLTDALNALDLALVDVSAMPPEERANVLLQQPLTSRTWDVPLSALTAGAGKLNAFAKTKKSKKRKDALTGETVGGVSREGLAERLDACAQSYPKTVLRFRKQGMDTLLDDLTKSLEGAKDKEGE
jgi:hypothetical protein